MITVVIVIGLGDGDDEAIAITMVIWSERERVRWRCSVQWLVSLCELCRYTQREREIVGACVLGWCVYNARFELNSSDDS